MHKLLVMNDNVLSFAGCAIPQISPPACLDFLQI